MIDDHLIFKSILFSPEYLYLRNWFKQVVKTSFWIPVYKLFNRLVCMLLFVHM